MRVTRIVKVERAVKLKGETRFGSPCRKCGGTERYISGGHCKACRIAEKRKFRRENAERLKPIYIERARRKVGTTQADYLAMNETQGGKCAICHRIPDYPLFNDHCHITGNHRGLLCARCNTGLGYFDDDPDRLAEAIRYLAKSNGEGSPTTSLPTVPGADAGTAGKLEPFNFSSTIGR